MIISENNVELYICIKILNKRVETMSCQLIILAQNICHLRNEMQLSREQLARYIGCSGSLIAKLETQSTKDPGWTTIHRLARLFGVTEIELMTTNLNELDIKTQTLNRINMNFDDQDWVSLVDFVEGATKRVAESGKFRQ